MKPDISGGYENYVPVILMTTKFAGGTGLLPPPLGRKESPEQVCCSLRKNKAQNLLELKRQSGGLEPAARA